LILFFVDLGEDPFQGLQTGGSPIVGYWWCGIAHTDGDTRFKTGPSPLVHLRLLSAVTAGGKAQFRPNNPLWGPYRRIAEGQGSGDPSSTLLAKKLDAVSTSSAGGIT
jgi:hypothetical protein